MEPKTSPMPTSSPRKKVIIIVLTVVVITGAAAGIYFKFFYKRNPTDQELRQQYATEVQTKLQEVLKLRLSESPVTPVSVDNAKKIDKALKNLVASTTPISESDQKNVNTAIGRLVASQEQGYQDWKKAQLEKK